MNAAIRKYSAADSQAVFAICRRSPEASQWSMDSFDQALGSGQPVLLAELDGQICGFLVARFVGIEGGTEGEVLNMAIAPAQRRKGVGSKLLAAVLAEARSQNVERMYLEVRESNLSAIALYERHNFCQTGKRPGYYRNPTENAVLMEKKLTG
jgi:ribosomal-protein-alanine N-acetyltransferase